MSTVVKFTKKDMNWGRIANPGWYRVRIDEVESKTSKDGKSTNYLFSAEILFDANNGDTEFQGCGIGGYAWMINSKMMGPGIELLKIFDVTVAEDQEIDLKASKGLELDVYVDNQIYEGRKQHKVNHKYRKPNPDVKAKTA